MTDSFPKHIEELFLTRVKTILISTALLNNLSANQFNYTRDRGLKGFTEKHLLQAGPLSNPTG